MDFTSDYTEGPPPILLLFRTLHDGYERTECPTTLICLGVVVLRVVVAGSRGRSTDVVSSTSDFQSKEKLEGIIS